MTVERGEVDLWPLQGPSINWGDLALSLLPLYTTGPLVGECAATVETTAVLPGQWSMGSFTSDMAMTATEVALLSADSVAVDRGEVCTLSRSCDFSAQPSSCAPRGYGPVARSN